MLISAVSLFINGLGVYLTIHAGLGAAPWDVLHLGISNSTGISYGNASVMISFAVLLIDILLREQIGISMVIDAIVVGKSVDFFNYINIVPVPGTLAGRLGMILIGIVICSYTQYLYMCASLGCGPRDTLLVGLKRHTKVLPIGAVSIILMSAVTLTGYLLGGPVGIGTLVCAFCTGPIMQTAFRSVHFDATRIRHQNIRESIRIIRHKMS
ncbi:MAG: hypothetical protein K5637_05280 [Lachnospiraceae bacterium]|nr:hypothetical protein [Lachnospiraceae bacterium]